MLKKIASFDLRGYRDLAEADGWLLAYGVLKRREYSLGNSSGHPVIQRRRDHGQ
jgi:hypothetical protein